MTKHILCATDGSKYGEKAVSYAAELAKLSNSKLTILAVRPFAMGRGGVMPLWEEEDVRKALSQAETLAKAAGATDVRTTEAEAADIAEAILAVAKQGHADQIVVGSAGKGVIKRAVIGSVSTQVVNHAQCPVTVVH